MLQRTSASETSAGIHSTSLPELSLAAGSQLVQFEVQSVHYLWCRSAFGDN